MNFTIKVQPFKLGRELTWVGGNNSSRRQGLRSSSSAKYVVQRTSTKLAERAFSVVGPSTWNSLQSPDSSLTLLFLNANLTRSSATAEKQRVSCAHI